jgi:hypothetical protein
MWFLILKVNILFNFLVDNINIINQDQYKLDTSQRTVQNNSLPTKLKEVEYKVCLNNFLNSYKGFFFNSENYPQMIKLLEKIDTKVPCIKEDYRTDYMQFRDNLLNQSSELLLNICFYYMWIHKSLLFTMKQRNIPLSIIKEIEISQKEEAMQRKDENRKENHLETVEAGRRKDIIREGMKTPTRKRPNHESKEDSRLNKKDSRIEEKFDEEKMKISDFIRSPHFPPNGPNEDHTNKCDLNKHSSRTPERKREKSSSPQRSKSVLRQQKDKSPIRDNDRNFNNSNCNRKESRTPDLNNRSCVEKDRKINQNERNNTQREKGENYQKERDSRQSHEFLSKKRSNVDENEKNDGNFKKLKVSESQKTPQAPLSVSLYYNFRNPYLEILALWWKNIKKKAKTKKKKKK